MVGRGVLTAIKRHVTDGASMALLDQRGGNVVRTESGTSQTPSGENAPPVFEVRPKLNLSSLLEIRQAPQATNLIVTGLTIMTLGGLKADLTTGAKRVRFHLSILAAPCGAWSLR